MLNVFRRRFRQILSTRLRSDRRRKQTFSRPLEALEERICPSVLNFIDVGGLAGQAVFGGGGANNDLQISVVGDTYTFTDPSDVITLGGGNLPTTNSGSGTNTVTFDITTTPLLAVTEFVINPNGGDDIITVNSFRPGAEGFEVRDDAGEGTDTVNINGDIGTMASPVATDGVLLSVEQINIGADIFTNNLNIAFGPAGGTTKVTLTGDTELDTGTGTVEVNSGTAPNDVTGVNTDLTITANSVQLNGNVTLGTGTLDITGTTLVQLGSGSATAVLAGGDVSLTSATQVALNDTVGSLAGSVTITSPVTTMGANGGTIAGNSISISGSLTNTSANATSLSANAGDVSVGGNLSSDTDVDIVAENNVDLDGAVGATAIALTATNGMITGGTLQTSVGDITISGPMTIDLPGSTLISSAGAITFDDTLTGNGNNLSLFAPTLVSVAGDVTNVQNFRAQEGTLADIDIVLGNVTARQIVANAGTGGTGSLTLNGDLSATDLGGGLVFLVGPVTLNGANRSVTSGGGAAQSIVVNGTLDGAAADTTNLLLDAGTMGDVTVNRPVGATNRLESLSLRGDTVQVDSTINVNTDLTVRGGNILLNGTVTGSGTGTALFAPAVVGGTLDLFNNPANTRVGTNTRIASDTLANIAPGQFADFQFGDAATAVLRILPDADNSPATGSLELDTPTHFEADAIIVSEDLDADGFDLTFETDNLAMYRGVQDAGDVIINKKFAGGTLELRGRIGSDSRWGNVNIVINAVGATVNAPDAGAALPVLGLGTDQPAVGLGGTSVNLTINADTLNALAPSAIVARQNLILNVDTLNLVGGVQTATAGTVTLGNMGSTIENIGGGVFSILLPAGTDLSLGGFDGNGGNLAIRGVGGQLGAVTLGDISDTGAVSLGTSATNDATTLNVAGDIVAESVVLRGDAINLDGTITAATGNVMLFGPVTLLGDSELNVTGPATSSVTVNGTIDGAFALDIDAGVGTVSLTQAVGGTTTLDSMSMLSGGVNYLTVPIEVTNSFSWIVGVGSNGINDRIIRAGAGSITSANGPIILEADVLQGITSGVNVIGPGQTLTERGAGD